MAGVHQKSTVGCTRNISFEQIPSCNFFIKELYWKFCDRMFHTLYCFSVFSVLPRVLLRVNLHEQYLTSVQSTS